VTPIDPRVVSAETLRAYPGLTTKEPPPRRWIVVVVAIWLVILAGGLGWALVHGKATDREQTTVAQAKPDVDHAIALIASAATADGRAVPVLADFVKAGNCKVSVFRGGERYERALTVLVPAGTEAALMHRIGDRLPASYHVQIADGTPALFFGDAGDFVRVTGAVPAPGEVRFVADTGNCRTLGELAPAAAFTGNRSLIAPVLSMLDVNVTSAQWSAFAVPCAAGGSMSTVEAVGPDGVVAGAADLRLALSGLGTVVVAAPETYAYRTGTTGVAVRVQNRHLLVTATTDCA
jgi:hypothetical protein